ncbi:MAG: hypothetical protein PUB49_00810 [Selenomonadaceae bacterium]|nr:hypothetical protein [Selenomonadaceae bacterium]
MAELCLDVFEVELPVPFMRLAMSWRSMWKVVAIPSFFRVME